MMARQGMKGKYVVGRQQQVEVNGRDWQAGRSGAKVGRWSQQVELAGSWQAGPAWPIAALTKGPERAFINPCQ